MEVKFITLTYDVGFFISALQQWQRASVSIIDVYMKPIKILLKHIGCLYYDGFDVVILSTRENTDSAHG